MKTETLERLATGLANSTKAHVQTQLEPLLARLASLEFQREVATTRLVDAEAKGQLASARIAVLEQEVQQLRTDLATTRAYPADAWGGSKIYRAQ